MNRGAGGPLCFLWYHESDGRGDPISEIAILHDDETVPPNFTKISRNILKGTGRASYICFRRDKDVDPIANVRIIYDNQSPGNVY